MDDSFATEFDDPRVTDRLCRHVPGEGSGDATLVGVVHDHPASVARVRIVCGTRSPDVLALELPSAAVPLYRAYAAEGDGPTPRFGGEMAAAIRAAPGADPVGIDAPSLSFCRRLATRLIADRVPPATARRLLASVGGATRQAMTCRLAATLTSATSMTVALDDPVEYACDRTDPPERQAEHERAHVAGVRALLSGDRTTVSYRDETRERCMIDRLEAARERGDVVAVVGVDHLDALARVL